MSNDEMSEFDAVTAVVGALCTIYGNANLADGWVKAVTQRGVAPNEIARQTRSLIVELKAAAEKAKEEQAKERADKDQQIADLRRLAGLGPQGG